MSINLMIRASDLPDAEAQCLWIIRKNLGDEVPVPEIYGWRVDGDYVFIYMELPQDPFIGSLSRGHLSDIIIESQPPGGLFAIIKQFSECFSSLPWLGFTLASNFKDPWREYLPDDGSIKPTPGDLYRGNIIVSPTTPPRALAIIDWAHCGWFPDYWEYCKAAHTCLYGGKWLNKWFPKFLTPWVEVHGIFAEYTYGMGAF
ncbi:uncharacterized protein EAF01_008216 [Botrytis porri]|uniref:Aminoglycoside phosphotransferase domain-containing protein n=1 Tax=Botrytis porri TaxID=87229 RepID=A0A4Z1L6R3_9HELO|nr:uncharacterized protein EAF01_008216 [Botrytis porri]KAF7899003.1 hypothetical protein EAF01_008216 [Botrytis porri]TGO92522.1 hypothetical protein BPOR_0001g00070 [Botrytis porri]